MTLDVIGLWYIKGRVTLKCFGPGVLEEYYFHYTPSTGAWDFAEKDSGETVEISEKLRDALIEAAKQVVEAEA